MLLTFVKAIDISEALYIIKLPRESFEARPEYFMYYQDSESNTLKMSTLNHTR